MPTTPQKLIQVIPQSVTFTPAGGGTAVSFTDFADPVTFSYSTEMVDVQSQSSTFSIAKLITGESAMVKALFNKVDLQQILGVTSNPASGYASASDTLTVAGGNFTAVYGALVFVGKDTISGHTVTVTLTKAIATPAMEISFGKAQEVRVGVTFQAMRPDTGSAFTIVYAIV